MNKKTLTFSVLVAILVATSISRMRAARSASPPSSIATFESDHFHLATVAKSQVLKNYIAATVIGFATVRGSLTAKASAGGNLDAFSDTIIPGTPPTGASTALHFDGTKLVLDADDGIKGVDLYVVTVYK